MRVFIIFFLFISCKSKFDVIKVEVETIHDSIKLNEFRYDLDNKIYSVGREFNYKAKIYQKKHVVDEYLIDYIIQGTTKPFSEFDENYNQTVFRMIYKDTLGTWLTAERTGLIENDKNLWMHPPRNEYPSFRKLQLNAFPFIVYPLKKTSWSWELGVSYGEFVRNNVRHDYKNIGKEIIYFKNQKIECWKIIANSHSNEGVSTSSIFFFNEKYGFVKMIFNTYDNQEYILELFDTTL